MFLRSLILKGFKSFADATALTFEPGVTVVVGPNGSGKSNVVDAIAWVLGAQAPSSVRSTKMDDVIFAGIAKRHTHFGKERAAPVRHVRERAVVEGRPAEGDRVVDCPRSVLGLHDDLRRHVSVSDLKTHGRRLRGDVMQRQS